MSPLAFFCLAVIAFGCSAFATWVMLGLLRGMAAFDKPEARSNHAIPTPVGGGVGMTMVMTLVAIMLAAVLGEHPLLAPPLWLAVAALCALSLMDDLRKLPVHVRMMAQCCAIVIGMGVVPNGVTQGWLPQPVESLLVLLAWFWFVNLYNFMDGIDGLAGSEAVCITLGVAGVAVLGGLAPQGIALACVVAAVTAGFLVFNWPPAKLFMGDSGSIPLGFVLGALLLWLAAQGYLAAAVILPAYFVADATFTLFARLVRREKVWQAHSQHAYQRAVRAGLPHARVTRAVIGVNLVLMALALWSMQGALEACVSVLAAYGVAALRMKLWFNYAHKTASGRPST